MEYIWGDPYKMGCGCVFEKTDTGFTMHWCSKHKAAEAMYEALLSALGIMATLDNSKGWVREINGVILKALSLAEGKEK